MFTRLGRGSRHGLKFLLPLGLAWLSAGFVSHTLHPSLSVFRSQSSECPSGTCLPLPRQTVLSSPTSILLDFASTARADEPVPAVEATAEKKEEPANDGELLFDGKTLDGWKESEFAGQGQVDVSEGRILLGVGQDMTGITWDGAELPKANYEIELEAMRVDGADFFCGLTFPVNDDTCSLIVGGWGGTIVGLSSIDRFDASMNETTKFMSFDRGKWYKVRLRVTPEKIFAWIDDKQVVDFAIEKHKISVRVEVQPSKPLGFATWQTSAALRDIRLRRLDDGDGSKPSEGQAAPRE
jgi:hypothetical protein